LWERKIELVFSTGIKKYLIDRGFDENYGARNLRRVIQSEIEDSLANELLKGNVRENLRLKVVLKGKTIAFKAIVRTPDDDDVDGTLDSDILESNAIEIKGL
jgi:ATP-dependent Clp protease ATP-binding subunit ClpB